MTVATMPANANARADPGMRHLIGASRSGPFGGPSICWRGQRPQAAVAKVARAARRRAPLTVNVERRLTACLRQCGRPADGCQGRGNAKGSNVKMKSAYEQTAGR